MSIQYVIRRIDFSYSDEYYQTNFPILGGVYQIYDDKQTAEEALKQLVVQEVENIDLESYDFGYGYADEAAYEAVEAFVLEKTGEEYDKDDGIPELDADALFEFAKLTGIVHYQLMEIDSEQKSYVVWLNQEQEYLSNYDTGALSFGESPLFLADDGMNWHFLDQVSVTLKGSLADLSDAPTLVQQVLERYNGLSYDAEQQTLTIQGNHAGYDAVAELNQLLKQPLFEIQEKTVSELQALS